MKKALIGFIAGLLCVISAAYALDLVQPNIIGGTIAGATQTDTRRALLNTQTGSTYTQVIGDDTIVANASGTQTITLLAAASYPGKRVRIQTIASQTVVSATSNVTPCTSGTAGTAILAGTAGKWADLESDGVNWRITACN